jgi:hypothetical protein
VPAPAASSTTAPPAMPVAAAAPAGPRIVEIAGGSLSMPGGAGEGAGPPAPAGTAAPQATSPVPAGQPAATPAPGTPASPAASAPAQAKGGVALLGRLLGILPLAAGLTQIVLGLMITRGTISIAAVPLLGALPKFITGGLVASTAMPSVMSGVMKLLGKEGPGLPGA